MQVINIAPTSIEYVFAIHCCHFFCPSPVCVGWPSCTFVGLMSIAVLEYRFACVHFHLVWAGPSHLSVGSIAI